MKKKKTVFVVKKILKENKIFSKKRDELLRLIPKKVLETRITKSNMLRLSNMVDSIKIGLCYKLANLLNFPKNWEYDQRFTNILDETINIPPEVLDQELEKISIGIIFTSRVADSVIGGVRR